MISEQGKDGRRERRLTERKDVVNSTAAIAGSEAAKVGTADGNVSPATDPEVLHSRAF